MNARPVYAHLNRHTSRVDPAGLKKVIDPGQKSS